VDPPLTDRTKLDLTHDTDPAGRCADRVVAVSSGSDPLHSEPRMANTTLKQTLAQIDNWIRSGAAARDIEHLARETMKRASERVPPDALRRLIQLAERLRPIAERAAAAAQAGADNVRRATGTGRGRKAGVKKGGAKKAAGKATAAKRTAARKAPAAKAPARKTAARKPAAKKAAAPRKTAAKKAAAPRKAAAAKKAPARKAAPRKAAAR
jgi:hypothetical protein